MLIYVRFTYKKISFADFSISKTYKHNNKHIINYNIFSYVIICENIQ
jgi:hypothetical protein